MKKLLIIFVVSIIIGLSLATFFSFSFSEKVSAETVKLPIYSDTEVKRMLAYVNINEDEIKKKFPPNILDISSSILKSKDKKILKYWASNSPEKTMNWVDSTKNIRLLVFNYIYPIWLKKDTSAAITWYESKSNKDELSFFLAHIGKYGKYKKVFGIYTKKSRL